MLQFWTLGRLDLRSGGAEVRSILSQPKRLGLLAYLASTAAGGYRRRDTILPLFWPELDHERARAALRQAVYVLRRDLGDDIVRARGEDELGIDPALVWCDASAFQLAIENGETGQAATLYRGDFLEGFFVSGAGPEFDAWVAGERARLRGLASRAAKAVAESETETDPAGAAVSIRGAVALATDDESTLRWALRLFDRIGDHAGALQLFEEFKERLAREYGAQPATETKTLIAALRQSREPAPAALEPSIPGRSAPSSPDASDPGSIRAAGHRRAIRWVLPACAAGLALIVMAMMAGPDDLPTDPNRVLALPMRVSASDSSLNYLREGMLDLLAAKLAAGSGPRLVDPRTAVFAWKRAGGAERDLSPRETRRLARAAGAGRILLGAVVGGQGRIDLQATLYDANSGRAEPPVTVSGSPDSLPVLVDRLAAGLALRAASEEETRLADLTTRSLPALQAYLAGKQAFRAGEYSASLREFGRALDLDSTFALAALALAESRDYWGNTRSAAGRGRRLAWQWQARLAPRDRDFLRFLLEPNYPGSSTLYERITNWEAAVSEFPDRAVAWYQYGDNLFHWGLQVGIMDAEARAGRAFDRAIALDSNFAPALEHRIWLAAVAGDGALLSQLGARYVASSPDAERLLTHQWRVAAGTGDSVALREARTKFETLPTSALISLVRMSQQEFVSLDDAEAALGIVQRRASTSEEEFISLLLEHDLAVERGQPHRAVRAVLRTKALENPNWTDAEGRTLVYDALYAGGDRQVAESTARVLGARAARPLPTELLARARRYFDLCTAAQWRIAVGDLEYGKEAARRLSATAVPQDQPGDVAEHQVCSAMLELQLALAEHQPTRAPAAKLDSLLTFAPWVYSLVRQAAALTLARAYEEQGDIPAALNAARRRELGLWNHLIATQSRTEGRLATLTGDRAGAARAYRKYLALRSDPESTLTVEVAEVRNALLALE